MNTSDIIQREIDIVTYRKRLVQKRLKNLPVGKIRVSQNKNRYSYYHCTDNSRGTYISMKNKAAIAKLCNKEFLLMAENAYNLILAALLNAQSVIDANNTTDIINKLHPAKIEMADTSIVSDIEYVRKWSNGEYEKLDNASLTYPTQKGDYARSKSEVLIMNYMYENNIFYRYEQILKFPDGVTFAPDFTLINPHTREIVYWEHFGMMDNPDYVERATYKISEYQRHGLKLGINFIYTFESGLHPFSVSIIKDYLDLNFKAS